MGFRKNKAPRIKKLQKWGQKFAAIIIAILLGATTTYGTTTNQVSCTEKGENIKRCTIFVPYDKFSNFTKQKNSIVTTAKSEIENHLGQGCSLTPKKPSFIKRAKAVRFTAEYQCSKTQKKGSALTKDYNTPSRTSQDRIKKSLDNCKKLGLPAFQCQSQEEGLKKARTQELAQREDSIINQQVLDGKKLSEIDRTQVANQARTKQQQEDKQVAIVDLASCRKQHNAKPDDPTPEECKEFENEIETAEANITQEAQTQEIKEEVAAGAPESSDETDKSSAPTSDDTEAVSETESSAEDASTEGDSNSEEGSESTSNADAGPEVASGESTGDTSAGSCTEKTLGYKSWRVFPTWGEESPEGEEIKAPRGIIGINEKSKEGLTQGKGRTLLYIIPKVTNILLKFIAPIVVVMFIYSGIRFVYAGDDEEQVTESKKFFHNALVGLIFVAISYSLMKGIYFTLSTGGSGSDSTMAAGSNCEGK